MRTRLFIEENRPASPARVAGALALSLALHALLLWAFRFGHMAPPAPPSPPPADALTVWIRPAPPTVIPMPMPIPAPSRPDTSSPAPRKAAPRKAAPSEAAPRREPIAPSRPAPTPAQAPTPPGAGRDVAGAAADKAENTGAASPAPAFDIEAARKTARALASQPDPARAATAVGQIPAKPLPDDTPLARHIAQAKRADCKDGVPGGLLAPLLLLMDKKDSGCKL
ncbi:MAG: hypothetical protein V4754_11775 [Pseudomonadota bacterium]